MSQFIHPFLQQCNRTPIEKTVSRGISLPIHQKLQKSYSQRSPKLIPIKINKRKFPQNFFPKYFSNNKINIMKIKQRKKRQNLFESKNEEQKSQELLGKSDSFINIQSQQIKNLSAYYYLQNINDSPSQKINNTQIKYIIYHPPKPKKILIDIFPSCCYPKTQTRKDLTSSTIQYSIIKAKQSKRKHYKLNINKNQNIQQNQRKYIFSERLIQNDISNCDPNNITFYSSKMTQLPILKIKNSKQF